MSGNIDPIYSRQGDLSRDSVKAFSQPLLNAPNEYSGTALGNVVLATADPVNGSFVQRLRLKALGSNVASVLRLFVNNGLSPGLSLLDHLFRLRGRSRCLRRLGGDCWRSIDRAEHDRPERVNLLRDHPCYRCG